MHLVSGTEIFMADVMSMVLEVRSLRTTPREPGELVARATRACRQSNKFPRFPEKLTKFRLAN